MTHWVVLHLVLAGLHSQQQQQRLTDLSEQPTSLCTASCGEGE